MEELQRAGAASEAEMAGEEAAGGAAGEVAEASRPRDLRRKSLVWCVVEWCVRRGGDDDDVGGVCLWWNGW